MTKQTTGSTRLTSTKKKRKGVHSKCKASNSKKSKFYLKKKVAQGY